MQIIQNIQNICKILREESVLRKDPMNMKTGKREEKIISDLPREHLKSEKHLTTVKPLSPTT